MKNLLIVANWKENKTVDESLQFMDEFKNAYSPRDGVSVIICPSFTSLSTLFQFVLENSTMLMLGAQDVSEFETGAHTGEISANQIAGLAKYIIIGHSERRAMGETDERIEKKILNTSAAGLTPILCVQNENTHVPPGVEIVAYEPIEAIGSGHPDTPENADYVAGELKQKNPEIKYVLYGGSVTDENANQFTLQENINGVLVGGASLIAETFSKIIKNA